jgi:type IV secretory pathway VirB10-like protein
MSEEKETPAEKAVTYNKRAAIVSMSLIGVLVVGLSIQTISNHQNHNPASAPEKAPGDNQPPKNVVSSMDDFVEKTTEITKQKRQDKQVETKEQERERLRQEIAARRNGDAEDKDGTGKGHYKSREELMAAFEMQELERALNARYNGSGGSGGSAAADKPKAPARDDVPLQAGRSSTNDQINTMNKIFEANNARAAALLASVEGGRAPQAEPTVLTVKSMSGGTNNAVIGESSEKRKVENGERTPRPGEVLLSTGSLISAIETFDTISDYDGAFRGIVSRDVYDVSKEFILIPIGSKIVGKTLRFSKINEAIQNRVGRAIEWIILPNGARIDLRKSSTIDHAGIMGLTGDVDYHLWAQFFGVVAYAVIGGAPSAELSAGEANGSRDVALRETTSGMRAAGRSIAQRYLSLTPTIKTSNGTPFKLFIEDDIYLKPWSRIDDVYYKNQE